MIVCKIVVLFLCCVVRNWNLIVIFRVNWIYKDCDYGLCIIGGIEIGYRGYESF